ncbi:MAG: GNAT family N-acetyltransferase [Victivallaceae bacterium]
MITIRKESPAEYHYVENLVRDAFWDVYRPGCDEHFLTNRLRQHPAFLAELSFVAELHGKIRGCVYFARAAIRRADGSTLEVATFGPLAVSPDFQRHGIGSALLEYTLPMARMAGFPAVVIYGNPAYYARFGFEPGEKYGVAAPDGEFCPALLTLALEENRDLAGRFEEGEAYRIEREAVAAFDKSFPRRAKHVLPGQIFPA